MSKASKVSRKKATAGEVVVMKWHNLTDPKWVRCSPTHRAKAKAIDSAIRRAVTKAWDERGIYEADPSFPYAESSAQENIRNSINAQYGTKL